MSTNKSLSDNTKTRFAVSLVEYLYENIPLTEMLSCLKVAKKHVNVYCFLEKHFTCWDLRGMLETDNFVQKDSKQTLLSPVCLFMSTIEFHLCFRIMFNPSQNIADYNNY